MSKIFDSDDFIKKAKQIEATSKRRTVIIIILILILVFAFIIYTTTIVKKSTEEVIALKDENTQIINIQNHEDSAKNVILNFFKFQNNNDSSGIVNLFADTIYRYYYIANPISVQKIKSNKDFSVNQKGKFRIDSTFQMSNNNDTLIANVISPIFDDNKMIANTFHTIKLNSSLRIIYVRAFTISDKK